MGWRGWFGGVVWGGWGRDEEERVVGCEAWGWFLGGGEEEIVDLGEDGVFRW